MRNVHALSGALSDDIVHTRPQNNDVQGEVSGVKTISWFWITVRVRLGQCQHTENSMTMSNKSLLGSGVFATWS